MNRKFWLLLKRKTKKQSLRDLTETSTAECTSRTLNPAFLISSTSVCILLLQLPQLHLSWHEQSFQVVLQYRWEEKRGIHASYFSAPEAHLPMIFYIQLKAESSVWQLHRTYLHFYSLTSKEVLKLKLKSEIKSVILKWETYQQKNTVVFFLLELVVWNNRTSDLFTWM